VSAVRDSSNLNFSGQGGFFLNGACPLFSYMPESLQTENPAVHVIWQNGLFFKYFRDKVDKFSI